MNNAQTPGPMVVCPTCGGKKQITRPANSFDPHGKKIVQPCFSCQHTGEVDVDRVCPDCGQFLQNCHCRPDERNVTVLKLAQPSTQENPEMSIDPKTGKRSYHKHGNGAKPAASPVKDLAQSGIGDYKLSDHRAAISPTPPPVIEAGPAQGNGPSLLDLIREAHAASGKAERLHADVEAAATEANRLSAEAAHADVEANRAWGRVEQELAPLSSPEAEALRYLISRK